MVDLGDYIGGAAIMIFAGRVCMCILWYVWSLLDSSGFLLALLVAFSSLLLLFSPVSYCSWCSFLFCLFALALWVPTSLSRNFGILLIPLPFKWVFPAPFQCSPRYLWPGLLLEHGSDVNEMETGTKITAISNPLCCCKRSQGFGRSPLLLGSKSL